MKRAVILHGTDGTPDVNWLPWARVELEKRGYDTWVPQLPECHTPNRFVYNDFLQTSGWDFADNVLIGHSSGATTVLNLLIADWAPVVREVILVGTFLNEDKLRGVDWYEEGQFEHLFPDSFDIEKLKSKAHKFVFIHGKDDPYCDYEEAAQLCGRLGGVFEPVEDGQHLSSNRKMLPELLPYL